MRPEQARHAAKVLRDRAPVQTHAGRHACFEAAKTLEDYAKDTEAYIDSRKRLRELAGLPKETIDATVRGD